ncbi:MAG: bacillithiol biosynthesis deacetylase BshB1 [Clostridia bacterium]|nr:bacillithiol biosynthesis deacetylase BshB1 [Clostridia bacterium]MCL6521026.1 bacillithiol biosynthesis deacetylase BshB1 [Bacillota bacterium]
MAGGAAAAAEPVEILAIGPHPDDIELGCAGLLALERRRGHRIGLVDLSRGEMGSRGDAEIRAREAEEAARRLGARFRLNLGLPDTAVRDEPEAARRLALWIRQARPVVVLAPWRSDRHPDHAAAGALAERAVLYAGLRRLELGAPYHVVRALLFYPINEAMERPSFCVDVGEVWEEKVAALEAHASQVGEAGLEIDRRFFGHGGFLEAMEARARQYGRMIGARYAEAYAMRDPLRLQDPLAFFAE